MIENFDKIKNYVLTLGEFTDSEKLDIHIKGLIDECLAYCYLSEVPESMEITLANVIVDEINKRALLGINGDIASYSEGDLSISFNSPSSSFSSKAFYNGKLEPFKRIIGVVKNV